MIYLDHVSVSEDARFLATASGLVTFTAWGWLAYHLGQRVADWSPEDRRGWRRLGWFTVALMALIVAALIYRIALIAYLRSEGRLP